MNKKPRSVSKAPRSPQAHRVRIIGGAWKRTPLPVLDAAGLRPTPDRVRETVFNWLTHLLDGDWAAVACLDLFAGTGALGLEAASRGAARVLLVEDNGALVRQLDAIKQKLQADAVTVLRGDALTVVQTLQRRGTTGTDCFNLIFLDPPYHSQSLERLLPQCVPLLAAGGTVYVEAEFSLLENIALEWLHGWQVVRADQAGLVFFHLLQRESAPPLQA